MNKLGWLLVAAGLGLGCGGGDGDSLEGVWTFGSSTSNGCILEYVFEDGAFKESTYCGLDTGRVGIELTTGGYQQRPGQITFTILRSTCPSAVREVVTLDYEISRSRLTLSTAEGVLGLTRQRKPAAIQGSGVNGCFEADNTFRANPIRDL